MSVDKNKIERRKKLKIQLKDKRYRDAFVSEYIDAGISFQIRALRKREGWTQKKLAELTGMAQERISVAENPNYSSFNIKTLKRIASAFDVALIVRFVPISELVNWELNLSSETLAPLGFVKDPYFKESTQTEEPKVTNLSLEGGLKLGGSLELTSTYSVQTENNLLKFDINKRRKPIGDALVGQQRPVGKTGIMQKLQVGQRL